MAARLAEILDLLEQIAPLALAEAWDNVGLLIDPVGDGTVTRCLLTIDLTDSVLDEAIESGCELIVAYHPPIFAPLRRLTQQSTKERRVLRAVRAGLAVYCPHTALDAAPSGVNDWLADGLGPGRRTSIAPAAGAADRRIVAQLPGPAAAEFARALRQAGLEPEEEGGRIVADCSASDVHCIEDIAAELPAELQRRIAVQQLIPLGRRGTGQGREVRLDTPTGLDDLVARIKHHLALEHVRLATAARHRNGSPIETIALCAGAGGSVLAGRAADLFWTGEMRHHDVLDALEAGTSVVLCDHTNTERGYLSVLRDRLAEGLGDRATVAIAGSDREPLQVV